MNAYKTHTVGNVSIATFSENQLKESKKRGGWMRDFGLMSSMKH